MPRKLLPANLDFLEALAPLLVVACFLVVTTSQPRLKEWSRRIALVTLVALLMIVPLQLVFVVHVSDEHYLVGYSLTSRGLAYMAELGSVSVAELVEKAGPDRIPVMWGFDYYVIAMIYAYSYIMFCSGVVLVLGATKLGEGRRKPRISSPRVSGSVGSAPAAG